MGKRLMYAVGVVHEGETHWFTPADDVPAWAVKLINPERFGDADPDETDAGPVDPAPAELPPRSGRGSGVAAWAAYAAAQDVEVEADATREDIITALDAAGVPTGPEPTPEPAAEPDPDPEPEPAADPEPDAADPAGS